MFIPDKEVCSFLTVVYQGKYVMQAKANGVVERYERSTSSECLFSPMCNAEESATLSRVPQINILVSLMQSIVSEFSLLPFKVIFEERLGIGSI